MDKFKLKDMIDDYIISHGKPEILDAIVVEGYDGVGKGKLLTALSEIYDVVPYRPDYNFWQRYDHRQIDRWKPSGFFLDMYSHFRSCYTLKAPMLFDRGALCGAVYNDDMTIAESYPYLIRGLHVLHILVTCDESDYYKFLEIRGVDESEFSILHEKYVTYTNRYLEAFRVSGVDYIVYKNLYDDHEAIIDSLTCSGCGHYSYGYCRHPKHNNKKVSSDSMRCFDSKDKEVQDINDHEMQCV